jgi:hypothetical protein
MHPSMHQHEDTGFGNMAIPELQYTPVLYTLAFRLASIRIIISTRPANLAAAAGSKEMGRRRKQSTGNSKSMCPKMFLWQTVHRHRL